MAKDNDLKTTDRSKEAKTQTPKAEKPKEAKARSKKSSQAAKETDVNAQNPDSSKKSDFLTYKGFPLVRNRDTIYFGNMSDSYVVMLQILEKTKISGLNVASRIKVYQMATDLNLSPVEAIVKQSEKNSLYEALDIAYIWLSRTS
jgi:hypothetical protein